MRFVVNLSKSHSGCICLTDECDGGGSEDGVLWGLGYRHANEELWRGSGGRGVSIYSKVWETLLIVEVD